MAEIIFKGDFVLNEVELPHRIRTKLDFFDADITAPLEDNLLSIYVGHEVKDSVAHIDVARVPYRYYLAHKEHPEWGLGILPVGVSGVTTYSDRGVFLTVLGRRAKELSSYANYWECVPSGSLELLDVKEQLFLEFEEELGLSRGVIEIIEPLGLFWDAQDEVYDCAYRLVLQLSQEDFVKQVHLSAEYSSLKCVSRDEWTRFSHTNEQEMVPVSLVLMAYCEDY